MSSDIYNAWIEALFSILAVLSKVKATKEIFLKTLSQETVISELNE